MFLDTNQQHPSFQVKGSFSTCRIYWSAKLAAALHKLMRGAYESKLNCLKKLKQKTSVKLNLLLSYMLKDFNECVCVWLWEWMSTPQEYGGLPLSQRALCVGTLPLNQHVYPSLVEPLFSLLSFCLFHFLSGSSRCSWPEGRPKTRNYGVKEA